MNARHNSLHDLIPAWDGDTLRPVDKLEVHQRGLKHKAVSVFLRNNDQVLLQKRADSKYHSGGLWANTCCTHPHWNEEPIDCAHRRLQQEIGVTGLELSHRGLVTYRADVGNGLTEHELVDVFVAEANTDLAYALNPDEVSDVKWMSVERLVKQLANRPGDYSAWLKIYMDKHRSQIFS